MTTRRWKPLFATVSKLSVVFLTECVILYIVIKKEAPGTGQTQSSERAEEMANVIEVTDRITSENFAVNPYAMRGFLENHVHIDFIPGASIKLERQVLQKYADEIDRICVDVLMDCDGGFSDLLHIDYSNGIYRGELPACRWIKVED